MPDTLISSLPGVGALLMLAVPKVVGWFRERQRARSALQLADQQTQSAYQASTLQSAASLTETFTQWVREMSDSHRRCEERSDEQQRTIDALQREMRELRNAAR